MWVSNKESTHICFNEEKIMKMSLLRWSNAIMFLVLVAVLGSIATFKLFLAGNETLIEIHETAGIIFSVLIGIHLVLNWTWLRKQYLR